MFKRNEGNANPIQPHIQPTTSAITLANRWGHFLARWGVHRSGHRVKPGLYALGNPTADSPVFVTANYTLSFDALRSALAGIDGYIMVLNTQGINVWCAAGKQKIGFFLLDMGKGMEYNHAFVEADGESQKKAVVGIGYHGAGGLAAYWRLRTVPAVSKKAADLTFKGKCLRAQAPRPSGY